VILDSSAAIAVLLSEPDAGRLLAVMSGGDRLSIGAPTYTEAGIVLVARLELHGWTILRRFVDEFGVDLVPFDEDHARLAVSAFRRYGKGRHPAALNLGDCLTYATARVTGEPLLCLGDDFARTDLQLVNF
jgi:ribonuclease VapC